MNSIGDLATIQTTNEWRSINEHYGDRVAERSRVPLINHIQDGLVVLNEINASLDAMRAYCLHPIYQADKDLIHAWRMDDLDEVSPRVLVLVMEYRNQANAWLSDKVAYARWTNSEGRVIASTIEATGKPSPGPLEEVSHMLIADKVQNYKDFCKHHRSTHARADELDIYFNAWLKVLDVDGDDLASLYAAVDEARSQGLWGRTS